MGNVIYEETVYVTDNRGQQYTVPRIAEHEHRVNENHLRALIDLINDHGIDYVLGSLDDSIKQKICQFLTENKDPFQYILDKLQSNLMRKI